MPRQGASQSALGNHPLNHIQEALLRLFAGLLDLLEPEFASSRGARRMPRAQRSRVPEGEPAQARGSEPSRPPKHTSSPPRADSPIPHAGRRPRGRERAAAASPQRLDFCIDYSLRWRRETVGAGRGAAEAAGGGLAGGGRPPRLRRRVPAAGTGWVAPREPETPPPLHVHVHARAHARTVTFKYNCVTVRRPRVYIKLSMAISIVLDSGVSLGCSPPPRKGARGRVHRPPSVPSSHGHAQVPDLTFDCNIRARRRRRRRLSGGATQTGRSGVFGRHPVALIHSPVYA